MRLQQFSVKGFKNFHQRIFLENMGEICVVHGDNNIGKSNVLEAMQLFFQLLRVQHQNSLVLSTEMSFSEIEQLGFIASDIFNLESPCTIELNAILNIRNQRTKRSGY
jgi:AAA15 family ATPase/GTPase